MRGLSLLATTIAFLLPVAISYTAAAELTPLGAKKFSKPNIILILADDLGYGELSCQGNPEIPTPHIDSIATGGVRFTSAYVTAPNCSPSRAGLLTGKFPTRFGHEFNPTGAKNENPAFGLPANQRTIADHLQQAGYVTGLFGKWHLGGTAKYHPYRRGFDEFFGFMHEGHFFVPHPWHGVTTMLRRKVLPGGGQGRRAFGNIVYGTHLSYNEPDYDANNPIVRGSQPVVESSYLTDAWSREAVDFIDRNQDKPFFLYIAHNAVHSPLQGADRYMQKFAHIKDIQRRIFAAMLANLDDSVGTVLKKIRQSRLEKDTLVIFLSDNGGPTRELTSSNLPLRGEKGQMYEGGIRIPFMMSWSGKLPTGKLYHQPVSSVDLHATALTIAGSKPDPKSDGVNLLPYLQDKKQGSPHKTLYWRQGHRAALRSDNWKLVRHSPKNKPDDWELYNLETDLSETNNLASTNPTELQELITQWQQYDNQMIDPVFK